MKGLSRNCHMPNKETGGKQKGDPDFSRSPVPE
jgi:hypothetical protein